MKIPPGFVLPPVMSLCNNILYSHFQTPPPLFFIASTVYSAGILCINCPQVNLYLRTPPTRFFRKFSMKLFRRFQYEFCITLPVQPQVIRICRNIQY